MESPLCPPVESGFRLIETLGYLPGHGFARRDRHLNRMARTAEALALPFDQPMVQVMLDEVDCDVALRCRLTMDVTGQFHLTAAPLAENPPVWQLAICETRLSSDDLWLRYKTTRREVYDTARAEMPKGIDELLFLNERGEPCEGTITNLFLEMRDGRRLTPPISCGLLPGILREELLEAEDYTEAVLTVEDLQDAQTIHMGNSLRGLIPVELAIL